jgi:predicted AAA+ superfamily ATPase
MNKVEINRVLEDWNFWKKPWEESVLRPFYLNKMKSYVQSGQVVVVTGARRSGKSFLMKQLASDLVKQGIEKRNVLFVNFEDPRWLNRDAKLLDEIFETYREFLQPDEKPYIFLDEVQEVNEWEKWVRSIHERNKATIIISGSNAKLLSRELGTVLTGRHIDLMVYPLSFSEFLDFKSVRVADESDLTIRAYLREYLTKGSFPGLVPLKDGIQEWFLSYYDDVLEKDLVKRFRVRKIVELKSLLNFYMSNVSKSMTFNSAAKFLKVSPDTVEKFVGYFEQAYLLFLVRRFSAGVKEQQRSSRKIYSIDTALSGAVGFRMSDDTGRIAENIVYLEYLRRKIIEPSIEIFYWKDEQLGVSGKEIDFVVKKGSSIEELVQVCMGDFSGDTRKREMRAIAKAMKKLQPKKITVVTEEFEGIENYLYGQVSFIPLWRWLLKKD